MDIFSIIAVIFIMLGAYTAFRVLNRNTPRVPAYKLMREFWEQENEKLNALLELDEDERNVG